MKSLSILAVAGLIWLTGLFAFANRVERSTPALEPEVADAVVVLTGGSTLRLEEGMQLLERGRGKRLLISGVNPETTREDIRELTKSYNRIFDCCVDLGFKAADTIGNARETAGWARSKSYDKLIVVTADFHMPRSLLELRGELPEAEFTAYPVKTGQLDASRWRRSGASAKFMMREYNKYLVVLAREAFLSLGPREAPAADRTEAVAARS